MFKEINLLDIPVYYINLDKDIEKRQAVEKTLSDLGFKHINRFPGVEASSKKLGVALSHYKIMNELKDYNKPFIVFEDDIMVHKFKAMLKVPRNADAYYLGNSFYGLYGGTGIRKISLEQIDPNTFQIFNMLAAHAILYLNSDYVKFLAKNLEFALKSNTNQDMVRASTMKFFNIYASRVPHFYQNGINSRATRIVLPGSSFVGRDKAY